MEKIVEQILLTEHFDIHQDWEVPIPGFFVVAAKDETKQSITEFSDAETTELFLAIKKVRSAMREVLGIDAVYFFQNEDTNHGFHIWMLPRYEWMEKFGRKIQSVRPIIDYAKAEMTSDMRVQDVKDAAEKVKIFLLNGQRE